MNTTWLPAAAAPSVLLPVEANVNRVCYFTYDDAYRCSIFRTDSTWLRDEALDNGAWIILNPAASGYAASGQAYEEDVTPLPGHPR